MNCSTGHIFFLSVADTCGWQSQSEVLQWAVCWSPAGLIAPDTGLQLSFRFSRSEGPGSLRWW